jgi:hypothetical protein
MRLNPENAGASASSAGKRRPPPSVCRANTAMSATASTAENQRSAKSGAGAAVHSPGRKYNAGGAAAASTICRPPWLMRSARYSSNHRLRAPHCQVSSPN